STRPLTDDEIALCRSFALSTLTETRQPAIWALGEAAARTSEIPHIRLSDLDLDRQLVWIHGSGRTEPRWGRITDWGALQLRRRAHVLDRRQETDPIIAYEGRSHGASGQSSSCAGMAATMRRAGLGNERDVRPASVAAWAGVRALANGKGIDWVARMLGVRSLDRAARLVGWNWFE